MTTAIPVTMRDTDAAIIVRSVRDPECFAEVFDRYYVPLHGFLARRLGQTLSQGERLATAGATVDADEDAGEHQNLRGSRGCHRRAVRAIAATDASTASGVPRGTARTGQAASRRTAPVTLPSTMRRSGP